MRNGFAIVGGVLVVAGGVLSTEEILGDALAIPVSPQILAALGVVIALGAAAVAVGPSRFDPDEPPGADETVLGAEFDATLASVETMSAVELRTADAPTELRDELREAVIALVASRTGVDPEAAADVVERGEWTDDAVAAAFLSESACPTAAVRWRERASTTPAVVSRVRRTVEALEAEL